MSGAIGELKAIHYRWPDDVEAQEGADHFGVQAQIFIGSTDEDTFDSFDLLACSPGWLAAAAERSWEVLEGAVLTGMTSGVAPGAGIWLLRTWSQDLFERSIRLVIDKSSPGPDWETVAARIGRHIPWEFDYKYDDRVNRQHGLPSPWR